MLGNFKISSSMVKISTDSEEKNDAKAPVAKGSAAKVRW